MVDVGVAWMVADKQDVQAWEFDGIECAFYVEFLSHIMNKFSLGKKPFYTRSTPLISVSLSPTFPMQRLNTISSLP